jgi:hypothetical protein
VGRASHNFPTTVSDALVFFHDASRWSSQMVPDINHYAVPLPQVLLSISHCVLLRAKYLFYLQYTVCIHLSLLFLVEYLHTLALFVLHRHSHNARLPHWTHSIASSCFDVVLCFCSSTSRLSLHWSVGGSDRLWYPRCGLLPLPRNARVSMSIPSSSTPQFTPHIV